jgi:hypothetical protein
MDTADAVGDASRTTPSKALDQVGLKLLASGLRYCVGDETGGAAAGSGEDEWSGCSCVWPK